MKHKPIDVKNVIEEQTERQVNVCKETSSIYKVTNCDGSNLRYAKVWNRSKIDLLEQAYSIASEIGMVDSQLIRGEFLIQLMQPADGECLSTLLPKCLFPIMWGINNNWIIDAFDQLGQNVGLLHSETTSDQVSLDSISFSFDTWGAVRNGKLAKPLSEILTQPVVTELNYRLSEGFESEVPISLVHGDLMLFHIYMDHSKVQLIDFDAIKRVPAIDDYVRFICALELMFSRLPYTRSNQIESLRIAFRQGYQRKGPNYNLKQKDFETMKAVRYCSLLLYYHQKLPKHTKWKLVALRNIDTLIIKKLVSRLIFDS